MIILGEGLGLGKRGEEIAYHHLRRKGYKILERNFRYRRFGEIDLIAAKEKTLIFCEVKTRFDKQFGKPFEAVTEPKRKRLRRLAECYLLKKNSLNKKFAVRFDVLSIFLNSSTKSLEISHLKNAF